MPLGCSHGHNMSYHLGQHTTCAKHLLTSCLRDGTKLSTQGWANSAFDRTCWRASPHGADISLQTKSLGNSDAFTRNHMLRTCAFERGWGRDKKCPCGVPKVRAIFDTRLFAWTPRLEDGSHQHSPKKSEAPFRTRLTQTCAILASDFCWYIKFYNLFHFVGLGSGCPDF